MKTRVLIIVIVVLGIGISLPFILGMVLTEKSNPTEMEIRIAESMNGISLSSNMDIYAIDFSDDEQSLILSVSTHTNGYIDMDDPLPVLQKLFPDKNIDSFIVLANGMEIPYTLENGKFGIQVNNSNLISIVGFSNNDSNLINPEKDIPIFFEVMLMEQEIEWNMPQREWNNPDFELEPPARVCSQIVNPNGTSVYVSTILLNSYELSNMTFHNSLPDDCLKVLPVTQIGRK